MDLLDRKIALNQQINAELEKMAKTLYDYWFVQFDFPDENGNPYKSSGGEMVYHPELKREVPKGWVCGNIMEIANLLGGGTPSKNNDEFWNGNIPFFTPTDCNNDVYILSTKDNITAIGLEKSSTKLFPENTILLTARGTVGKLSLNAIPMAMNQSCYALMAKDEISYSFLYFLARQLIHILEIKATGSVFNSIVSNDIENTFLTIPEKIKIQEFGEICEPIFEKIKTNAKETQKLTQLRDFLLPMLMNGQVEVV
ncbi:restriction endonuclease subunit S [Actinobacillus equuli subsp. equuli]|nr:restriction endonuclease subunit S [Actinobacillus equuli]WGE57099.1 restriction endonuclease subunit S [Actinobacillus equuli subsp. equuli]